MELNIGLIVILSIISYSSGVSFNQPKFCSNASWNQSAITFADNSTIGSNIHGIFVNNKNTVYAADRNNNRTLIWTERALNITRILTGDLIFPHSVFVTNTDDIYVDNGYANDRVDLWTFNTKGSIPELQVTDACYGLFVDIDNYLYCSVQYLHYVIRKPLKDNNNRLITIFGTGCAGMTPTMLNRPVGIFVDIRLNLYVADSRNDRIQFFPSGQSKAITVAGNGSSDPFLLRTPIGIVLDADENLFIVDQQNNRIVRSGPNGFQCIIGCNSSVDQLNNPRGISFDSYGNIYVVNSNIRRIQIFLLVMNTCNETKTDESTMIFTIISDTLTTTNSVAQYANSSPITAFSTNRPKFCPNALWNPNGTTLQKIGRFDTSPLGIYVDINNTVYIADRVDNRIIICPDGACFSTNNISANLDSPYSLFVTFTGDIYIDNGKQNGCVEKWTSNGTNSTPVLFVTKACYGLFVDINDNLYCSIKDMHRVIKKSPDNHPNNSIVVAGTGCAGSPSHMLRDPNGIFVDDHFNLYVADSGNNRIQLFQRGLLNAITVAGSGASGSIALYSPTGVVLDAERYLFIVDQKNHRIVGSGPRGFRCIIGCTGYNGSSPNQLLYPRTLSFDTYGNIYVSDTNNNRIQKFFLASNSCDEAPTLPTIIGLTIPIEESSVPATTSKMSISNIISSSQEVKVTNITDQTSMITTLADTTNQTDTIQTVASVADQTDTATSGVHITQHSDKTTTMLGAMNETSMTITGADITHQPAETTMVTGTTDQTSVTTAVAFTTHRSDTATTVSDSIDRTTMSTLEAEINDRPDLTTAVTNPVDQTAMSTLKVETTDRRDVTTVVTTVVDQTTMTTSEAETTDRTDQTTTVTNAVDQTTMTTSEAETTDRTDLTTAVTNAVDQTTMSPSKVKTTDRTDLTTAVTTGVDQTTMGTSKAETTDRTDLTTVVTTAVDQTTMTTFKAESTDRTDLTTVVTNAVDQTTMTTSGARTIDPTEITSRVTSTADQIGVTTAVTTIIDRTKMTTRFTSIADQASIHTEETRSASGTTALSTMVSSVAPVSSIFIPRSCPNPNQIGINCSVSAMPCDLLKPCQNNGTCISNNTTLHGYICSCSSGFNGTNCEIDVRPCKAHTCWNQGTCNETSHNTFNCLCQPGWFGTRCEKQINYCDNITCQNRGVCLPSLLNFTCECVATSYSGRYCEITATEMIVYQTVSKSFGYIAILFLASVVLFIVVMDILKYGFGIDPTKDELERIRRIKRAQRRRPPPVIERVTYVP